MEVQRDDKQLQISYDNLNRLTSATLFTNNTPGPKYLESFTYDKKGNINT